MRDGWRTFRLHDVLEQVKRTVAVSDVECVPYAGVRLDLGGVYCREPVSSGQVQATTLWRVQAGDVVYNRMWATRGAFGVAGPAVDGCLVSNDFPTFVVCPEMSSPAYIELALHSSAFLAAAEATATGSTGRRRLKEREFLDLGIQLPPLEEQQRIVDLIGSLDDAITTADEEVESTGQALRAIRQQMLINSAPVKALEDLVEFASGYSFPPTYQGKSEGDFPFYKVSDMNSPGNEHQMNNASNWITSEDQKSLRCRVWPEGTVIFPKVGAALGTEKRRLLSVPSAFDNNLMGLIAGPEILAEYLFLFMEQVVLGDLAQVGPVPSINQGHIRSLKMGVPTLKEQKSVVDVVESTRASVAASAAMAAHLRASRSELLTVLLSGEHQIPDSYAADASPPIAA